MSRYKQRAQLPWFRDLAYFIPLLLLVTLFVCVIVVKGSSLLFCLLVSGGMTVAIAYWGRRLGISKQWLLFFQFLAIALVTSTLWLNFLAEPANAQFFKKAEDFFQNTLTQGSTTTDNTRTAISLVFNVLRAIYLLYIAGSLIGIINAVRKDEDWQSVARIPLLVIIAVTIADVLTSFIVGEPNK
jgi:hypothetical protein